MRCSDPDWFFQDNTPENSEWKLLDPTLLASGGVMPVSTPTYMVVEGQRYKVKEITFDTTSGASAVLEKVGPYTHTFTPSGIGFKTETVKGLFPLVEIKDEPELFVPCKPKLTWDDPRSNPLQDVIDHVAEGLKPLGKVFSDSIDAIRYAFEQIPKEVKCQKHPTLTVKSNGLCVICEKEQRSRHGFSSLKMKGSTGQKNRGKNTKQSKQARKRNG